MLSTIAKLFDPMGWLSPITVVGKRMVQALWKKKPSWDDHLPMNLHKGRQKFIQELPNLSKVHIPRFITWGMSKGTPQLHYLKEEDGYGLYRCFCMSSDKGYPPRTSGELDV